MALVLTQQAITLAADPTTELQVALKDFQDALSVDQRQLFVANTTTPDVESVTLFVANTAAQNQGAKGKFLWRRLCAFLQATQQFTRVVDTFVSSNPAIAALVWGGVKTAITTASNAASYFDQVTGLIMEIGTISPTFNEFGKLYTDHKGVQQALCRFYAIVVRVCTKIVVVSQRDTTTRFVSSLWNPFESEFATFLKMLTKAAGEVRDQVSLAAKQAAAESSRLLEYDAKANDLHRKLASKFRSYAGAEYEAMARYRVKQLQLRSQTIKDEICDNLSDIDYLKAWRLAIHPTVPNTAQWFKDSDEFQHWKSSKQSALLWCSGTMGTGKTVFVANMIAHLLEHRESNHVVCFHLCRSDHAASLTARGILGTLSRQLIQESICDAGINTLDHILKTTQSIHCKGIIDLVVDHMKKGNDYYIIVDGLDECEDTELSIVSNAIESWSSSFLGSVKILYSGRPELESRLVTWHQRVFSLSLNRSQVHNDLETYIEVMLDNCLSNQQLTLGDPSLILQILQSLRDGADGMFLWVRFFIGDLCACLSDYEILKVLEQPPKGIRKLLNNILTRIEEGNSSTLAMRTLQYSLAAKRPLEAAEMQEALSVEEDQKLLDRNKMPSNMSRIVSSCRGLLYLDEVENTIHCVHHSVKTHIFEQGMDTSPHLDSIQADLKMGSVCLTYLHFADFETQLTRAGESPSVPIQPIDLAVLPIASESRTASIMARKLLLRRSRLQAKDIKELKRGIEDFSESLKRTNSYQTWGLVQYRFRAYAQSHWLDHFESVQCETLLEVDSGHSLRPELDLPQVSQRLWKQFHKTVQSEVSCVQKPWLQEEVPDLADCPESLQIRAIQWAVRRNHQFLFIHVLLHICNHIYYSKLLTLAGRLNDTRILTLLMILWTMICHNHDQSTAQADLPDRLRGSINLLSTQSIDYLQSWVISSNMGFNLHSALGVAVFFENFHLVDTLLEAGADPLCRANGLTPLEWSITTRNYDLIRKILDTIPDATWIYGLHFFLYEAYRNCEFRVVETVLKKKLQYTDWFDELLNAACKDNQSGIVASLLDNTSGFTTLSLDRSLADAVQSERGEIVKILLANGANPDYTCNDSGRKILFRAIMEENHDIIQMLLTSGANCASLTIRTPDTLRECLLCGQIEVVGHMVRRVSQKMRVHVGPLAVALWRSDSETIKDLMPKIWVDYPAELWFPHIELNYREYGKRVTFKILHGLLREGIARGMKKIMSGMRAAVRGGHFDVFNTYLSAGFDLNYRYGNKPLITLAVQYDRLEMVNSLIEKGARVNCENSCDISPVLSAIKLGKSTILERLLMNGADPNTICDGFAALQFARMWRTPKCCKLLKEYGALSPTPPPKPEALPDSDTTDGPRPSDILARDHQIEPALIGLALEKQDE